MADDPERIREAEERSARVDITLARRLQESIEKQFALENENRELRKDRGRLEFLEAMSRRSQTGVSIEIDNNKEWRVMWYHMICGSYPTIRDVIDESRKKVEKEDAAGQ